MMRTTQGALAAAELRRDGVRTVEEVHGAVEAERHGVADEEPEAVTPDEGRRVDRHVIVHVGAALVAEAAAGGGVRSR
jgi:hypothetical protein